MCFFFQLHVFPVILKLFYLYFCSILIMLKNINTSQLCLKFKGLIYNETYPTWVLLAATFANLVSNLLYDSSTWQLQTNNKHFSSIDVKAFRIILMYSCMRRGLSRKIIILTDTLCNYSNEDIICIFNCLYHIDPQYCDKPAEQRPIKIYNETVLNQMICIFKSCFLCT